MPTRTHLAAVVAAALLLHAPLATAQMTVGESLYNTAAEVLQDAVELRATANAINQELKRARTAFWTEQSSGGGSAETAAAYANALRSKDAWFLNHVYIKDRDLRVLGPGAGSGQRELLTLIGGDVDGGIQPFARLAFWEYGAAVVDFAVRVQRRPELGEQLLPGLNKLRAQYESKRNLAERLFENPNSPLRSADPTTFAVGLILAGDGAADDESARVLLAFLSETCGEDTVLAITEDLRPKLALTRTVRRANARPHDSDFHWLYVENALQTKSARLFTLGAIRQAADVSWRAAEEIVREWESSLGKSRVAEALERLWRTSIEESQRSGLYAPARLSVLASSLGVDIQGLQPGIIVLRRDWISALDSLRDGAEDPLVRLPQVFGGAGESDPTLARLRARLGEDLLRVALLGAKREAASERQSDLPLLLLVHAERHAIAQRRPEAFALCQLLWRSRFASETAPRGLSTWAAALDAYGALESKHGAHLLEAAEKIRLLMAAGPTNKSYLAECPLCSRLDAFDYVLGGGDAVEFMNASERERRAQEKERWAESQRQVVDNARTQLQRAIELSHGELKAAPDAVDKIAAAWTRFEDTKDPADAARAAALRDELGEQLRAAVEALRARGWHRVGTAATDVDFCRKTIDFAFIHVRAPEGSNAGSANIGSPQPAATQQQPAREGERRRGRRGAKSP